MLNEDKLCTKIGRLGLIVGAGDLPVLVYKRAKILQIPVHNILLNGISDQNAFSENDPWFAIGSISKIFKSLHDAGCKSVCFAGKINRPDFSKLKLDAYGLRNLPAILLAASKGDDFLLRAIIRLFEKEGFQIIAPQEIIDDIIAPLGLLNNTSASKRDLLDIKKAYEIARAIGQLDIGQGAVVCNGLVLAVEAQEGTDEMLRRCADLDENIRGSSVKRAGVLVKCMKPNQEEKVDMPTLGIKTVQLAIEAGLSGIGFVAGKTFLIDRDLMCSLAEENGLFLVGINEQNNSENN
ncbi:UDP-2,3-diacylglucosamine diphosphatase LpxI [Oceanicaulis sp. AH-315-P02]|nr:UDP-2,3-diacylglucosamine diphosphatase LpxI [Robiginitomaculum sp.]MBN4047750.1 UDP-2,3-diacylglucosamine diphosphatase LpxI [Oceanicaulis sp. AH-315-P02]